MCPKYLARKPSLTSLCGGPAILPKLSKINIVYIHIKFTRSPLFYTKYASKRNSVKFLIRSAKAKYDNSLMQKFKSNPKALYSYVRSNSKVRFRIGQLKKDDGTLTLSDKEAAEMLSSF